MCLRNFDSEKALSQSTEDVDTGKVAREGVHPTLRKEAS
jgi:hypothetical protein